MNKKWLFGVALLVIILAVLAAVLVPRRTAQPVAVNYGISPYQDTILPVVAEEKGWYREQNLDVRLHVLPWGEVMPALASRSVDVAIQNFNSFQAAYANTTGQGADLVFFYPLFVFKGAAILAFPESRVKPLSAFLATNGGNREKAVQETARQLAGKTVYATKNTEMEQIVQAAVQKGHLSDSDVNIVHAEPDLGLNAFLKEKGVLFSGGVTERMKAQQNGAVVILEAADLTPPVIDGLVTSRKFASEHKEELFKIIDLWYRTIAFMEADLKNNSRVVLGRLSKVASIQYTPDEYARLWTDVEVFPKTPDEMHQKVLSPDAPYYWRRSWQGNNEFLGKQKPSVAPVPESAFLGEEVQMEYLRWKSTQLKAAP